jgi:signal transduction histidine kinase
MTLSRTRIAADPDRLRQILTNLLTNAAKFTPRGSITLTIGPSARANMVDVTVRDTGPGIAPDDLPRIFDLFYRADRSSGVSGAGIGLFLSRQLATLMGGQLTVDSILGAGSTFTLSLPRGDGE